MFLILAQLPPPVHGAAVINQKAKTLITLMHPKSRFINISTAKEIGDVGQPSTIKILKTALIILIIIRNLFRREIKYCYINLHPTGKVFLRDAFLCFISKLFRKKVILHLHGRGIAEEKSFFLNLAHRIAFKNNLVIHLSDIFYSEISKFVKKSHFVSVPNCAEDRPDLETRYTGGKIRFYYFSNYIRGKGALELLRAAKHIYHVDINCEFVFAGGWFDSDFKDAIDRWRIENRHLFDCGYIEIHGPLHGVQKDSFIKNSHAFIFPSYIDTFPLVILEAMSAGKLIISTTTGAAPEILENGAAGLLVPEKDYLALADMISYVIQNPKIINDYSISARNRYLKNYTEEIFSMKFCEAIQSFTEKTKDE